MGVIMQKIKTILLISFISVSFSQVFFSEYAEGSSNHKYLEIYNATDQTIDLTGYAFPNATNGANTDGTYDYWNDFDAGSSVAPGDVFVICHPSADDIIQSDCDQQHTYLSNGDDGFCLVEGNELSFSILDCIGTWSSVHPGDGWDVAGVSSATKDHTLVRKGYVLNGNSGNWEFSAGTDSNDSEWLVYDQNTWDYLGYHDIDESGNIYGCMDPSACNYNPDATADNGTCAEEDCLGECGGDAIVDDCGICDGQNSSMDCAGICDGDSVEDECGICDGDGTGCEDQAIFFSEYAEGSSNHKYLEIYNGTNQTINLNEYAFPNATNGANTDGTYDYWNEFDAGSSVAPGDVFVICHGSADDFIQTECDQHHTYLSNGDDGFCLVQGNESSFSILDCIGTWSSEDPGDGWDVAGISSATKDHTLVRKADILIGNGGNWELSAGTNAENSEWVVFDQNTWDYLGSHPNDFDNIQGCMDPEAENYNPNATIDDGSCQYAYDLTINDIQGQENESPFTGYFVNSSGIVTGVSYAGFFIQDGYGAWNGIWVYQSSPVVSIGDFVEVSGIVAEYNGLTEIEATNVTIISSDNTLPDPVELQTGELNESYEGVRVQFSNAICNLLPNDYGEWQVNDGSGDAIIDDRLSLPEVDINLTQSYDIVGVVDCYTTFKVQSTSVSIHYEEGQNIPPTAIAGDDQIVDFSQSVTLDGTTSYDPDGVIIGFIWVQESGIPVSFGDYEEPIIEFIAPDEFTELIFSLQVIDNEGTESFLDYVSISVGLPSIYDIQYTEDQGQYCYETELAGTEATVMGVITHMSSTSSGVPYLFVQDMDTDNLWSAITVFGDLPNLPNVGDKINITGTVNEYYSLTQITDVSYLEVISSGNHVAPTLVDAIDIGIECSLSGEMHESMFVEVHNITFDSVDEFGNWTISDNSGSTIVDDYHFDNSLGSWPNLSVGTMYDCLKGIVSYSYSEFKIYPRNINDFICSDDCIGNGDINNDDFINVLDIVAVVNFVLGTEVPTVNQICSADMNADEILNVLDIITIVNIIINS